MTRAGKQSKASPRLCFVRRFGQNAAATGDDGIRSQHNGVGIGRGDRPRLGACHPASQVARQLPFQRCFIDVRRHYQVWPLADLLEQRNPPGRRGRQDQSQWRQPRTEYGCERAGCLTSIEALTCNGM